MEKIDFDSWIRDFTIPEITYFAAFDSATFLVTGIYPSHALPKDRDLVEVDTPTALLINEGKIQIQHCRVNNITGQFEVSDMTEVVKNDQVLFRVSEAQWTPVVDPDVILTYNKNYNTIKFELSVNLGGTYKSEVHKPRPICWPMNTELSFLITDYNDPNIIRNFIVFNISELIGRSFTVESAILGVDRFSIFTRKLFSSYVMESK